MATVARTRAQLITNSSKPSEKEALQPKPAQLDSDGKVISTHATHEPKAPTQVQTVSWRPWLDAQFLNHDEMYARSVIMSSMLAMHKSASAMPLALILDGTSTRMRATEQLMPRKLMIPVYFRKHQSLNAAVAVGCSTSGVVRHPHAVECVVKWPVSEAEKKAGLEDGEREKIFFVQPEFRLPKSTTNKANEFEWSKTDDVHPFWGIKRQALDIDAWNLSLIHISEPTRPY